MVTGGDGGGNAGPSPFQSPAKSPAKIGPSLGGLGAPAAKALKFTCDPPTLNQRQAYSDKVDELGQEMIRMLVERHDADGFQSTIADLDALIARTKKIKGAGQSREFFRAIPRAIHGLHRGRTRIGVNARAPLRRALRKSGQAGSKRPIIAGRIQKKSSQASQEANKLLNKAKHNQKSG